ncbi:MAG: DUF1176 domain-containing protein [Rhodothermales bacterium]|nr:DUF1176 domain-containing protein [Rhodothermales bacterium]
MRWSAFTTVFFACVMASCGAPGEEPVAEAVAEPEIGQPTTPATEALPDTTSSQNRLAEAAAFLSDRFADDCIDREDGFASPFPDEVYALPAEGFRLYRMHCGMGAYNSNEVWLLESPGGGREVINFSTPIAEYTYTDEEETELAEPPTVKRYEEVSFLVNSAYDPETWEITSFAKWRGLGDAWSAGTWTFTGEAFELTRYEEDPTWSANRPREDGTIDETSWELFPEVRIRSSF